METAKAARLLLRWTVRNTTIASSLLSPHVQTGRRFLIQPRCLCSSNSHGVLQSTEHASKVAPVSDNSVPQMSLQSLMDMGFTDMQAEQIHATVSGLRGKSSAKNTPSVLTVLLLLGLNPTSVHKLLLKCPEMTTLKESELQQRINNLRKLGFREGSLQRVVTYYPQILTVPVKTVKSMVLFLRERCLFTVQQVTEILKDSPSIVLENQSKVQYKFQYVYFRMGVKQAEMIKAKLFRCAVDDIRCRHTFLERRCLYQTPDKKGQTLIKNPKLDSILNVDQDTFITKVAQATFDEYDVFQRLMARERREEEMEYGGIEAEGDNDEYDEAEEEDGEGEDDEESEGKSGYGKKRKK